MKKLVFSLAMLIPTLANAVPNAWQTGGNQGIYENTISDTQGNRFLLQCDEGYTEDDNLEDRKHRVALILKNNKEIEDVIIVIKGKNYSPLQIELFLDDGREDWKNFNKALAKATQFDVYNSNKTKKLATFKPIKALGSSCRI